MVRTEARPQVCALAIFALCSSAAATADSRLSAPSASVTRARNASRELASHSRTVRDDAARIAQRVLSNTDAQRQSDGGTARSKNFTVWAPAGDGLAERVLEAAEQFRREIAGDWLGRELPAGCERTIINVELTGGADVGLAMFDDGRAELRNRIWLKTSPDLAVGTTLAHEIAHVVLSARFPVHMPVWANEGIACQYDDAGRMTRRQQLLTQFVRTGCWPRVARLFAADVIVPTDEASYAAAVSLTEYLVTLADQPTFLEFVADGQDHGWDAALSRHYEIGSVTDLESRWRSSVTEELSVAQRPPSIPATGRWIPSTAY